MSPTIGLTAPLSSGKDVFAKRLQLHGFMCLSLSDEVRKEARLRGLPDTREVLQNVGDSLRLEFGNDVLAKRIAEIIDEMRSQEPAQKVLIDGLRNPGEILYLKEHYGMYTVGITVDEEVRMQRTIARARESDPLTDVEALRRAMQRDRGVGQSEHGQNVDACLVLADKIIENNGSLEEFDGKIGKLLISLGIEGAPKTKEDR